MLRLIESQSPDEDSLSSDCVKLICFMQNCIVRLNPLTRIHCLPTKRFKLCDQRAVRRDVSIP